MFQEINLSNNSWEIYLYRFFNKNVKMKDQIVNDKSLLNDI